MKEDRVPAVAPRAPRKDSRIDHDPSRTTPPANAFVPVPGCWTCALLAGVAHGAWRGEDGLTPRDWLSVTASGILHRMTAHD
ncbi:hypothetical protein [Streptomyces sp. NPDC001091]